MPALSSQKSNGNSCGGKMDGEFSHAHFDGVLIDLIMQDIKDDKLPDEDVMAPDIHILQGENEDESFTLLKEKDEKWQELPTCIAKMR